MQINNKCFGNCKQGSVKYSTLGGRASGDMNTALGNCLIMSGMIYSYVKFRGIKIKLMNNGDDCVVFMERSDLPRFSTGLVQWFHEMGFNMKVEPPFQCIEEIEFCQMHPVWTPEGYLFCRNLETGIAKDAVSIDPLPTSGEVRGWLKAVGMGGLSLAGGMPIFQEHYRRYLEAAGNATPRKLNQITGLEYYARGMNKTYGPICERTRFSFYLAFGVTPDMQIAIEEHIRDHPIDVEQREIGEVYNLPDWFRRM